jgi:serine/threonine protein kinase
MGNRKILIQTLEALPLFDNRFKNLKCVNYDLVTNTKIGCFSIVFKAFDSLENKDVAIKFYDPDPTTIGNVYRVRAFEREPEILNGIKNKRRCLQIVSGLKTYPLNIPLPDGHIFQLPCKFFVLEWLDDDIENFFENQESIDAIAKLELFKEIALAISALHTNDVHHRDLKSDNLRLKLEAKDSQMIVAIDMGAAARAQDENLLDEYKSHVGAPGYAAPECVVGFAGDRILGPLSDWYALGCLLFELFNKDYFYIAYRRSNPNFDAVLAAIALDLQRHSKKTDKLIRLDINLNTFKTNATTPPSDGPGSSTPSAIAYELTHLIGKLTSLDYRDRLNDIHSIISRANSCIKIIENHQLVQKRKEMKRILKLQRIDKIMKQEAKAIAYVAGGKK